MDSGAVFLIVGILVFGLQIGATLAVIQLWRTYRPADPVSALSLLGPPALSIMAAMGLALAPALLRIATSVEGTMVGNVTEGLKFGSMILLMAMLSAAWSGAWAYTLLGLLLAISARMRADAPWLLKSAGLTGAVVAALSGLAFMLMFFGMRALTTGSETMHGE